MDINFTKHNEKILYTGCPRKSGYERMCQYLKTILCTFLRLWYLIAMSFSKKLQQTPCQLSKKFWRYDPKRKRCCRKFFALFGLNERISFMPWILVQHSGLFNLLYKAIKDNYGTGFCGTSGYLWASSTQQYQTGTNIIRELWRHKVRPLENGIWKNGKYIYLRASYRENHTFSSFSERFCKIGIFYPLFCLFIHKGKHPF